jgi:DUF1680 family protein
VAGADLELELSTDYPWSGLVALKVLAAPPAARGACAAHSRLERQHERQNQ